MSPNTPLRIVLAGGSGQVGNVVGNVLARHFYSRGDKVVVLSRRAVQAPWRVALWDGVNLGTWALELENADVANRVGLPATDLMLELGAFFLRTESELILKSRRVTPARLIADGFQFRFAEWSLAAADLVAQWRCRYGHARLQSAPPLEYEAKTRVRG